MEQPPPPTHPLLNSPVTISREDLAGLIRDLNSLRMQVVVLQQVVEAQRNLLAQAFSSEYSRQYPTPET